ncbi:MAG: type I-U CRISPR-associated protein Cas5/Cas6 [Desulfococcus sp. 4484_241]|nr:MAG: type I-U CRISPR-associated protein Cas5/Cas6 [Desulfococcus sp. 4484_241]
MKTLCITIHFLDERFHGQGDYGPEWPPSPFRLFQAMLAASSRNGNDADDAFQWLEQLSPPQILAPQASEAKRFKTYVPNNDSDKKFKRQDNREGKIFQPVNISSDCPVCYLWQTEPDDQGVAEKIALQARQVTAVGWGIDLVAVDAKILSKTGADNLIENYPGFHWKPTTYSQNVLRCPKPGSLADLRDAYRSFLNRFEGNIYRPARKPMEFAEIAYARVGAVERRVSPFKLLRPEDDSDRWANFDQRRAMEIAAWVRGYLCRASKVMDFPGDSEVYVAGHVPWHKKNDKTPPRFSYLPVPSIGHDYADGRIRRFIVAEPYGGDGRYVQWARRVLANTVATDKKGDPQAMLRPMERPDNIIRLYTREAKTFYSVTPVVLPGYDDMKYRKAEKLVIKAIKQAGFADDDVEDIYLQKAPFHRGSYGPRSYALPRYLEGRSAMHVRLTWKDSIAGPLAIGAGRHFGLGLFTPEAG